MGEEQHSGCRVCGRTDVTLNTDGTLRHHVHADRKGSSFLLPRGNRCDGTGHPPQGVIGAYAEAVVETLREDFEDLKQPMVAEIIAEAIQQYRALPKPSGGFECLLTAHGSWRLKPHREAPGRVRVACWQPQPSDVAQAREDRLNAALDKIRVR